MQLQRPSHVWRLRGRLALADRAWSLRRCRSRRPGSVGLRGLAGRHPRRRRPGLGFPRRADRRRAAPRAHLVGARGSRRPVGRFHRYVRSGDGAPCCVRVRRRGTRIPAQDRWPRRARASTDPQPR